nr:hypothetical protein [Streptomyces diastaticus]
MAHDEEDSAGPDLRGKTLDHLGDLALGWVQVVGSDEIEVVG